MTAMMGTRERLINGDEYDCFSRRARRIHGSRAGRGSYTKRSFWQRVRKLHRLRIRLS